MFLLDTNVLSELRKVGDGRADARVTAWISGHDAASLYISALTLMELEIGILRIERRDSEQGARLRSWMDRHVLPEFLERTLPVDSAVALKCARLHVPDPPTRGRHSGLHRQAQRRPQTLQMDQVRRRHPRRRQTLLPAGRSKLMPRTLDSGD